jgi:hypothetical protein
MDKRLCHRWIHALGVSGSDLPKPKRCKIALAACWADCHHDGIINDVNHCISTQQVQRDEMPILK